MKLILSSSGYIEVEKVVKVTESKGGLYLPPAKTKFNGGQLCRVVSEGKLHGKVIVARVMDLEPFHLDGKDRFIMREVSVVFIAELEEGESVEDAIMADKNFGLDMTEYGTEKL